MDIILIVLIIGFLTLFLMLFGFLKSVIQLLHRQQAPIIDAVNISFEEGEKVNGEPSFSCKVTPKMFNASMAPQVFLVAELYEEQDSPYYFSEPIHHFHSHAEETSLEATIRQEIEVRDQESKEKHIKLFLFYNDTYGNLFVNPIHMNDDSNKYTLKSPTIVYQHGSTSYGDIERMFKKLQSAQSSS